MSRINEQLSQKVNQKLDVFRLLDQAITDGQLIKTNSGKLFVSCFATLDGFLKFETKNGGFLRKGHPYYLLYENNTVRRFNYYSVAILAFFLKFRKRSHQS